MTLSTPLAKAKADEVQRSGRIAGAVPGLRNLGLDAEAIFLFSTLMAWGSLATKTSRVGTLPFNFKIADMFTILKTAPVSTGNKRLVVGTSTDDDLYFVTGNFKFVSGDSTTSQGGVVRRGSATNLVVTDGNMGAAVQFKLRPTAAVVSNGGGVYGVLVVVPRM